LNRVWIIDDEPSICWALRKNLELDRYSVEVYSSAEAAMEHWRDAARPDVVLLDVRLPGMDGLALLRKLKELHPDLSVIIMTAFGDLETAVAAVRGQAFEYLTKPFDLEQALETVRRAFHQKHLHHELKDAAESPQTRHEFLIGRSASMQNLYKQIAIAAKTDSIVLIEGEEGTGKSLVASMIHRFSHRHDHPFLPSNSKIESDYESECELFGSIGSNDTSGHAMRTGLFELAQQGTVLVEDVGAISLGLQIKILHALETHSFHRIGDSSAKPLLCRVLFSSSQELGRLLAEGEIDRRLASQLEIFRIALPPLRQRREDIPPLVHSFLANRGNHRAMHITAKAMEELERREWPGNVRELKQTIERAAIRSTGSMIQLEDLPPARSFEDAAFAPTSRHATLQEAVRQWTAERLASDQQRITDENVSWEALGTLYEDCLNVVELPLLKSVLEFHSMNRAAAASHLGLHRSTLRQKMRRYNIE